MFDSQQTHIFNLNASFMALSIFLTITFIVIN